MTIPLVKIKPAKNRSPFENSTPYDLQFGFWGVVTAVNSENCSVNVRLFSGLILEDVPVASREWVTATESKHLTGERDLPPVDSYVFCAMPNGEPTSAFVLCSGFARYEAIHADFKQKDKENIVEKVDSAYWHFTTDNKSGTRKIENKTDEESTISLEINQESAGDEKAILTIHGNKIEISKDGIKINTEKDVSLNISGNVSLKTDGNAQIEAQNVTVKSAQKTEIKGGQVVLGGTVAPSGNGALCAIPACAFSGAPHIGNIAQNA